MTKETRNTVIEYLVLCGFLAVLLYCVIAGSRYAARARAEAERDKHFRGATHSVPAMAFTDEWPAPWTAEKWAEFCVLYATANADEQAAMEAWLAWWWPDLAMPISRSKRVIVGSEGRRHQYTRVRIKGGDMPKET